MKRYQDIKILLEEVSNQIEFIVNQSKLAKTDDNIVNISKPKLKSILEHLRSCLEYCAHDLAEIILNIPTNNIYFPYGKNKLLFESNINKKFKNLPSSFINIIESIQPHYCSSNWLVELCSFTNHNKHNSLQNQRRENLGSPTIQIGNILSFEGGNLTIGEIVCDGQLINPSGPLELSDKKELSEIRAEILEHITINRTHKHVTFVDDDTGIDLIQLIEKSHVEINKFIETLYLEINSSI